MTFNKVLLSLGSVALAAAGAASSYKVTLFQPSWVAGTELKAGEYKIEVDGGKATFKNGRHKVEAAVKVETNGEKYSSTSVRYSNGDGKYKVQEIRLGGTSTKLVFNN